MKGIKFGSKKRSPKGEGYKHVQLPVDLIEDLKMYKNTNCAIIFLQQSFNLIKYRNVRREPLYAAKMLTV